MPTYEELRQHHVADAAAMLPEMLTRLEWPSERLSEHRTTELRRLVRVARDLSPWHRKRLADVNPEEVDVTTLAELPVMTKDDLMAYFDEIVTDDRLRLDVVEAHLETLITGDAYLFDRYHACASGGSSGQRGIFVYDWDAWAACYCSWARPIVRAFRLDPELVGAPMRMAVVAAAHPTHMTSSLPQLSTPGGVWYRFPVTLALDEIVAGLNEAQPTVLFGYPSALHPLTHEVHEGRLRIQPRWVVSHSEVLLPETRAALEAAFAVAVGNLWGTSEACVVGVSCRSGPGLHLSDDLAIVEPVDVAGHPVPPGVRSDKIYLTNLFNHALPLIRFEVTDQLTLMADGPCRCGSAFGRIEDPYGRLDDVFDYDGLTVHPHVFRSPLSLHRHVVEYQVQQTTRGAAISVRCSGAVNLPALETEIAEELARVGLFAPAVTVTSVERLERQASGKLKRFLPLAT
jgi:phenylacetate-CoA ligase